jgi:hypothetical protein
VTISRYRLATLAGIAISISVAIPSRCYAALEQLSLTLPATPAGASDLDLDVLNDAPFTFGPANKFATGGFNPNPITSQSDPTHGSVHFKGAPVAGTTMTIGIVIDTGFQSFQVNTLNWSFPNGTTQAIPGLVGAKFKAKPFGDPMIDFTITNTTSGYLLFTDVATLSNSPDLPLGDPVGSIPGFVPLWASLLLAPGQTSPDFISPEVDAGNFLYVDATAFESDVNGDELSDPLYVRYGPGTGDLGDVVPRFRRPCSLSTNEVDRFRRMRKEAALGRPRLRLWTRDGSPVRFAAIKVWPVP